MITRLPHRFSPYDHQREFLHKSFDERVRYIYWVAHRRYGKDLVCLNTVVGHACRDVGLYYYLFPKHKQVRKAIWRGMDNDGRRFLDYIPKSLIAGKPNSSEMTVEFKNGSIIQFSGSDNYDTLVGANPRGIVQSEFPLHHPLALQYLKPILVRNGGWLILNGTPRGKNHAYDLWQKTVDDPEWYNKLLTVDDTRDNNGKPIISLAEIEKERRQGVPEEIIRQEYYCDWSIGVYGAYYTEEINRAEKEGRICNFEINPRLPVFTFWDLGVSAEDACAVTMIQQNGENVDVIYYYEGYSKGLPEHMKKLMEIAIKLGGLKYKYHWAPHDINHRETFSARTTLSIAYEQGIHFLITPNVKIESGIQAVREMFPKCRFHKTNCALLITALTEYKREWDEENKVFKKTAFHNWASHPADSFRYFAVVWRENYTRPDLTAPRKFVSNI